MFETEREREGEKERRERGGVVYFPKSNVFYPQNCFQPILAYVQLARHPGAILIHLIMFFI